jgi:hypothetical protein
MWNAIYDTWQARVAMDYGEVIASMARCLVDSGHQIQDVQDAMERFTDEDLWERVGGPAVDRLAETLGLEDA